MPAFLVPLIFPLCLYFEENSVKVRMKVEPSEKGWLVSYLVEIPHAWFASNRLETLADTREDVVGKYALSISEKITAFGVMPPEGLVKCCKNKDKWKLPFTRLSS